MRAGRPLAGLLLAGALLLGVQEASAQTSRNEVNVEAHGVWKRVANGPNVTGGYGPEVRASYALPISDDARVAFGVNFLVVGLGRGPRSIWTLGGPTLAVSGRPWSAPVWLTAGIALEFGRAQICNKWASTPICPRHIGLFPELDVAILWEPGKGVKLGPSGGVQYFSSAVGTVVGANIAVSGVFSFGVGAK